jgi:hypothetical protein
MDANDAVYNTNKFDGIFTQYQKYIVDGTIPSGQTFNIPAGDISPANSIVYLESMKTRQDDYLDILGDTEKAFYIDQQWADAYEQYLTTVGASSTDGVSYIQNGVRVRAYKGIPIFVNKLFRPVLKQITGDASPHFGILTLRGNFIFATDKNYGEGPDLNVALKVWYDWDELTWKYLNVLKAGTAIALPENSVLALPE